MKVVLIALFIVVFFVIVITVVIAIGYRRAIKDDSSLVNQFRRSVKNGNTYMVNNEECKIVCRCASNDDIQTCYYVCNNIGCACEITGFNGEIHITGKSKRIKKFYALYESARSK